MEQFFVPFRERKHPVWPNGARLAVVLYVGLEEWNADAMVRYNRPPPLAPPLLPGMRRGDLAITTTTEYGYRVGIYRLMEVWDDLGVRPTLLANGLAVEQHPALVRELLAKGHRIVAHAWEQSRFITQLSREEQADDIARTLRAIEAVGGGRPRGWGSPATRQTEETLELLAEAGFEFHVGLHNDELPYFIRLDSGKTLLEIPYRLIDTGEINDFQIYSREHVRIWPEAVEYMKAFFDARYEAAESKPALLAVGCHPYVSGRPDRARAYRLFLEYVRGFADLFLTDFEGIFEWWRQYRDASPR